MLPRVAIWDDRPQGQRSRPGDALAGATIGSPTATAGGNHRGRARLHSRVGERAGDPAMIDEAAACCRLALQERKHERTQERAPQDWVESMTLLAQIERREPTGAPSHPSREQPGGNW